MLFVLILKSRKMLLFVCFRSLTFIPFGITWGNQWLIGRFFLTTFQQMSRDSISEVSKMVVICDEMELPFEMWRAARMNMTDVCFDDCNWVQSKWGAISHEMQLISDSWVKCTSQWSCWGCRRVPLKLNAHSIKFDSAFNSTVNRPPSRSLNPFVVESTLEQINLTQFDPVKTTGRQIDRQSCTLTVAGSLSSNILHWFMILQTKFLIRRH